VTPEARRDRGRDFAARWGRSRLSSCFGRVLIHPFLLVHLVVSSAAYVSARVTMGSFVARKLDMALEGNSGFPIKRHLSRPVYHADSVPL